MRLAVTMGEEVLTDEKGNITFAWGLLAGPDVPIDVQKTDRKKLIQSGGKDSDRQFKRLILLSTTGEVKRCKFKSPEISKGLKAADAAKQSAMDKAEKASAKAREAKQKKLEGMDKARKAAAQEKDAKKRDKQIKDRMKTVAADRAKKKAAAIAKQKELAAKNKAENAAAEAKKNKSGNKNL